MGARRRFSREFKVEAAKLVTDRLAQARKRDGAINVRRYSAGRGSVPA